MKKMLSLLILISLFFNLLADTIVCPRVNWICCENSTVDTCKCLDKAVEATCGVSVKCDNDSQQPFYSKTGGAIDANCVLHINHL